MSDRIVAVFHNQRTAETEDHPVQISVQIPGGNNTMNTYLSLTEAVTLCCGLKSYLLEHDGHQ